MGWPPRMHIPEIALLHARFGQTVARAISSRFVCRSVALSAIPVPPGFGSLGNTLSHWWGLCGKSSRMLYHNSPDATMHSLQKWCCRKGQSGCCLAVQAQCRFCADQYQLRFGHCEQCFCNRRAGTVLRR